MTYKLPPVAYQWDPKYKVDPPFEVGDLVMLKEAKYIMNPATKMYFPKFFYGMAIVLENKKITLSSGENSVEEFCFTVFWHLKEQIKIATYVWDGSITLVSHKPEQ